MKRSINFTYLSSLLTVVACFVGSFQASAQIISPTATEVQYSYTATFETPVDADESTDEARAEKHASHLFGILHSPTLIHHYGIKSETEGGIGAPQSQMKIKILSSETIEKTFKITYSNTGKMILNKKAAAKILAAGQITLPLPSNTYSIYNEKCTDSHYTSFGDYWYFYDPFREGCTQLSQEPMAHKVTLTIKPTATKKMDLTPKFPMLRGNNGNGDLFSIYVIHGYAESASTKEDEGRVNFNEFDQYMQSKGFTESREPSGTQVPLHVFKKELQLDNNKTIQVEVKHMLVSTGIESKSKAFAKFFKVAVENADVIIYAGHSGLGGNLDIPSLETKAGTYKFNPKKKQLFYFDSCSSYSYYLQPFASEKTKSKIDILTNGLSSYFHTSTAVISALMDQLLSEESKDVPWIDLLKEMEAPLKDDSYLLNVGGV